MHGGRSVHRYVLPASQPSLPSPNAADGGHVEGPHAVYTPAQLSAAAAHRRVYEDLSLQPLLPPKQQATAPAIVRGSHESSGSTSRDRASGRGNRPVGAPRTLSPGQHPSHHHGSEQLLKMPKLKDSSYRSKDKTTTANMGHGTEQSVTGKISKGHRDAKDTLHTDVTDTGFKHRHRSVISNRLCLPAIRSQSQPQDGGVPKLNFPTHGEWTRQCMSQSLPVHKVNNKETESTPHHTVPGNPCLRQHKDVWTSLTSATPAIIVTDPQSKTVQVSPPITNFLNAQETKKRKTVGFQMEPLCVPSAVLTDPVSEEFDPSTELRDASPRSILKKRRISGTATDDMTRLPPLQKTRGMASLVRHSHAATRPPAPAQVRFTHSQEFARALQNLKSGSSDGLASVD